MHEIYMVYGYLVDNFDLIYHIYSECPWCRLVLPDGTLMTDHFDESNGVCSSDPVYTASDATNFMNLKHCKFYGEPDFQDSPIYVGVLVAIINVNDPRKTKFKYEFSDPTLIEHLKEVTSSSLAKLLCGKPQMYTVTALPDY